MPRNSWAPIIDLALVQLLIVHVHVLGTILFPRTKRALVFAVAAVLAAGCGSPPEPEPTAEEAACASYCAAANDLTCATNADCEGNCLSLFELGCNALLMDFMECAAPALADDCSPRDPDGGHACAEPLASYLNCLPANLDAFSGCGPSIGQSGGIDPACIGSLECDGVSLAVECDETGACACRRNGEVVGTCDNIMTSAYLCAPHASCCTPLFTSN